MISADRLASRIMWSLLIGLILGVIARLIAGANPAANSTLQWSAINILDPIGQVFLRTLFFVVMPLVFASLALGVVQLGRLDKLGPLAGKTFALFFANMAVGVALGLLMMNLVQPGRSIDTATKEKMLTEFSANAKEVQSRAATQPKITPTFLVDMFMPRNLLRAIVVDFEVLPLIMFALLLGAAGTTLPDAQRQKFQHGLEIIAELMMRIVSFALVIAPVAVPCMIASVIIKYGFTLLQSLIIFVVGVLVVMAIHLFGTMSLMLKLFSKVSPRDFFRAVRTILITAFSTSSSNATLPTTIKVSQEKLGISPPTAGFVLPLGATMNMSGTALYEGCVVLFIAQVYGVHLGVGQQITLLLLAVLSAVAVAGIPGASLPLIVGLLINFGIPPEGIALIIGVDRILDMARTVLNVGADVVTAVIVDQPITAKTPNSA